MHARLIVAALFIALVASYPTSGHEALNSLRPLIVASSPASRNLAPRLSGGFEWAPLRAQRGGDEPPADVADAAVRRAAAELVLENSDNPAAEARHAIAVSELLSGREREAAEVLDALIREHSSPAVWSDLAASRFALATSERNPAELAQALVAADAALARDPNCAEARFNRALILESLDLRDSSREEWQNYLRIDGESGWANEARAHIRALEPEESFATRFARQYEYLLTHAAAARALAREYPQESRIAGEEEILARWGAAVLAGNDAGAEKHLLFAGVIGGELVAHGGDEMLSDLVNAIEHARPAERETLARAHVDFHRGRELYRSRHLKDAEEALAEASAAFDRAGSPGALMARAFTANTIFEELRVEESGDRLRAVLAAAGSHYPALRAQIEWELGGVALSATHWGDSLRAFRESLSLFESLGERNYAAVIRGLLAWVYDRIGAPDEAWKHRVLALQELGRSPSVRLHQAIDAVTQAAIAEGDSPLAVSFLQLDIDLAERMRNPHVIIESHIARAELERGLKQTTAAESDLREARRAISSLKDTSDRTYYDADANAVEAILTSDPAAAVALLSNAIAFHGTIGRRMHLPWLLMERGKALLKLGDRDRAAADFETGIRELENSRSSLAVGEDRWGIFHAADGLFSAAMALALNRGETMRAFDYVERERARGLLDALDTVWRPVTAADVPSGTTLVSYAFADDHLVIFVLGRQGVEVERQNVTVDELRREIVAFNAAITSANDGAIRTCGLALYRVLIAPVERYFRSSTRVAFVIDGRMGNIPFAALSDENGDYLVKSHAVTVEPSGAVFARLNTARAASGEQRALIITGADDRGALPAADEETRAVAMQYKRVTRLSHGEATAESFAREAATADIIHYAGHAIASPISRGNAFLALTRTSDDTTFDVRQIAKLHLARRPVVVLAACGTAAGEVRATEGSISVARAFLAAGASSVIATLRPIDDRESSEFFPAFHRLIAAGAQPSEALRQTQLQWIAQQRSAARIWSAVEVVGE